MKNRLFFLVVTLLVSPCARSATADDYWVDAVSGDDAAGVGSEASPWKTITRAFAQISGIGDTLHVEPGAYDSALGEVFPLVPPSGLTVRSTEGPDNTRVIGVGESRVFQVHNTIYFAETRIEGLTIEGGSDGVGVHDESGNYFVFLVNNTITRNLRAGVYAGTRVDTENGRLFGNTITENRIGFYQKGIDGSSGWGLQDNSICKNLEDGVRIHLWQSGSTVGSNRDLIAHNGGIGFTQVVEPGFVTSIQTRFTNSTITKNAGGGLFTSGDYACFYIPYFGIRCYDPLASIGVFQTTVEGNGGFGGAMRSGTSGLVFGHIGASVAWGNTPLDNVNFRSSGSVIGTGIIDDSDVSVDPKFVNAAAGDLRIRFDSPCVDFRLSAPVILDIEGENRGFDGDGVDDSGREDDIGSDEFHTLVFPGTAPVAGQPFWFEAQSPPAENGNLVTIVLSLDDGSNSGGILVPGSGGRRLDLEADALFSFGLSVLPFLQTTLQNQVGLTPSCNLPNGGFAAPIYYAAVTLDVAGGQFVSVTPTHAFVIQ